ncbi:hypothetical protein [Ruminococcus sp.]|uniref:hypothetical protein n=1 Tax=Ruminococcus sp. TaxID=41978 RepID=UPI002FDABB2D
MNIFKEYVRWWSRSERWLALDLHTPPEARKLGGGSNIILLALSGNQLTVWNRTQAHVLTFCISPRKGFV